MNKEINKITKEIGKIKNVKAVYLFGSYARNEQHILSDIDLCVIGNLNEKEKLRIMGFSSDKIDISPFSNLPLTIQFRVFKEGKALLVKDEKFLKITKIITLKEYWDFKKVLNKYIWEILHVQPR